jgi:hypothetical protein
MRCTVFLALILVGVMGCATYRDDLARGQNYYNLTQYDNALSVWRMLERDWDSLEPGEQARYAYFRGMTDYRMGYRADARHWLAISKAINEKHPGGLDSSALNQLEQVLAPLNEAVYSAGPPTSAVAAGRELTNEAPPAAATAEPAPNSPMTQPQASATPSDAASAAAPPATTVAPTAVAPGAVPPPSK